MLSIRVIRGNRDNQLIGGGRFNHLREFADDSLFARATRAGNWELDSFGGLESFSNRRIEGWNED